MVVGGMANAVWGEPRATLDIDITIRICTMLKILLPAKKTSWILLIWNRELKNWPKFWKNRKF